MKFLFTCLLLMPLAISAKIYKCKSADGSITFSKNVCPENQKEQAIKNFNQSAKSEPSKPKATQKYGVPIYAGAKVNSNRTSKSGRKDIGIRDLIYSVNATRDEVLAFYQQQPQIETCKRNEMAGMHWCQLKKTKRLSHGDLTITASEDNKSTLVNIGLFYFK